MQGSNSRSGIGSQSINLAAASATAICRAVKQITSVNVVNSERIFGETWPYH